MKNKKRRGVYYEPFLYLLLTFLLGVAIGVMMNMMTGPAASAAEKPEDIRATIMPVAPMVEKCIELPEEPEEVEPDPQSMVWFIVTAYCRCDLCCGKDSSDPAYGITATGTVATQGRTIAVDPTVIGYGSVVYFEGIDGFGGYVAEDTGSSIRGNHIDLFFDDHQQALEWGIKELEVFTIR